MSVRFREMSERKFRGLVRQTVMDVLREILEDPDAGLPLRPAFVRRLRRSLAYLDGGGKTLPAAEMARRLGLTW